MNKVISVPKNKDAEVRLNYNEALHFELIEINLTIEEFNYLWDKGVFHLINNICNSIIDDNEDESINDLNLIKKTHQELNNRYSECKNIIDMFQYALTYKTSIHFYF